MSGRLKRAKMGLPKSQTFPQEQCSPATDQGQRYAEMLKIQSSQFLKTFLYNSWEVPNPTFYCLMAHLSFHIDSQLFWGLSENCVLPIPMVYHGLPLIFPIQLSPVSDSRIGLTELSRWPGEKELLSHSLTAPPKKYGGVLRGFQS